MTNRDKAYEDLINKEIEKMEEIIKLHMLENLAKGTPDWLYENDKNQYYAEKEALAKSSKLYSKETDNTLEYNDYD